MNRKPESYTDCYICFWRANKQSGIMKHREWKSEQEARELYRLLYLFLEGE